MNPIAEKNRQSWNACAARYSAKEHKEDKINAILEDPSTTFHPTTWELIRSVFPNFQGKHVCVPSSGDNHAVFAFAKLGARVTSCDISENQLANAQRVAVQHGLDIEFIRADTMTLESVPSDTYDFVYTSNGVHVWINDLPGMYRNIHRIMRPGAAYIMYEIHPFQRPFDGEDLTQLTVIKPYSSTGPIKSDIEVTFHWRMQDIVNAMLSAGLALRRMEEIYPQIDYDDPDWIPLEQQLSEPGRVYEKSAVDKMYDWHFNPMAALPQMLSMVAIKS